MRDVEVVGTRGDDTFLVATCDGKAFVLQTKHTPPLVWPEKLIEAHLKFGGWEPFDGEPGPILRAAEQARPVNPRDEDLFNRGFTRVQPPKGTVKIILGPPAEKMAAELRESRRAEVRPG